MFGLSEDKVFAIAALVSLALVGAAFLVPERRRSLAVWPAAVAVLATAFYGIANYEELTPGLKFEHARAVDGAKVIVAALAAFAVFFELHRVGIGRPVAYKWKKFVGITLGIAAISLYFNGYKFGYPKYYHRWDQYHYYMGAKYYPEMGYDGLYKCSLLAQDELGNTDYLTDSGKTARMDLRKEVHHPDKKIRNLGGDNLLMTVKEVIADPGQCKSKFSIERWAAYKEDVKFFRTQSDAKYWEDMQKDHGYNPPPVWMIAGRFLAELYPAGERFDIPVVGRTYWLQLIAMVDIVYLVSTFIALYWAFGWRVFAVGAIFWGCQSSAPFYWTGGAMLRQDWLFFLVLSVCLMRKRYFKLAGASLAYTALLRIFPGLVVVGMVGMLGTYFYKHRRFHPDHIKVLWGGLGAGAVLIPLSMYVCGDTREKLGKNDSYTEFYNHTLKVHDTTPLTNHMGLRVILGHKSVFELPKLGIGVGPDSGRMKYNKDMRETDPFKGWKDKRNERYEQIKWVGYGITLATFAWLCVIFRRIRTTWVGVCLSQIFIILMSQLTCYYYSFMILMAPLTRLRPGLEVPIFGLAILTQAAWNFTIWNDDRYTLLTYFSLFFLYGVLYVFWKRFSAAAEKATLQGAAPPSPQTPEPA